MPASPSPIGTLSTASAKVSLLTVSVALVFATILLIFFGYLSLRQSLVEDVTVQSRLIADSSVAAILFDDKVASEETLSSLRLAPAISAAAVFSDTNVLMARYPDSTTNTLAAPSEDLLNRGHEFYWGRVIVAHHVISDSNVVGSVILQVDLAQMYERLITFALITFSIVLASMGFAYLLVRRMRRVVSEAEAHLIRLAHLDPVTGLPNRHAFNERLAHSISKAMRAKGALELLLLDLDNFKIVNDTLGHNSGDQLLYLVAHRMTAALRDDDVIFRIGGDEFAVILESATLKRKGGAVAAKIIASLAAPYKIGQHEIYVTASVGIAAAPENGCDLPTLTRNADTAMYQAKALGKNRYTQFETEMDQVAQKRMLLETNLRKALERNELSLNYQPKLSLANNQIVGLEALLRWNHPELGAISPAEFIPVAEECGLILPIGHWVVQTACSDMAQWRDQGLGDINVAVNLSVRQTKSDALLPEILASLKTWQLRPDQLSLEITESVLMENIESNISLLDQLRAHGIKLSIDDFGTGYSSLAYLKRLRIDELKIDRAFVQDIPGNGEDEAIVTAIIALAHSLGLSVVAEGVETAEQLAFLRLARCDHMQGYYFSRPMKAHRVASFLAEESARLASIVLTPQLTLPTHHCGAIINM